jgi:hypothetical protein
MVVTLVEPPPPGPVTPAPVPVGWEGILGEGEEILWQGAPDRRFRWELRSPKAIKFIVGAAVAVVLLAANSKYSHRADMMDTALIFAFWLVVMAIAYHIHSFWNRWRSFYTLTNERGIIATQKWGVPALKSFRISGTTELRLEDTNPGSVYFAKELVPVRWLPNHDRWWRDEDKAMTLKDVGFVDIDDARRVYSLIYKLRESYQ